MKTVLSFILLLPMLLAVGFSGSAYGDDSQNTPKVHQLREIVVSGAGSEAAGTVTRITAAEIRDLGARTLDEALRLVPGLYVRIGNAGTPRIDIRGFRTRHVRLLLDGIPIEDTYDGQFDPTAIPVEHIAEIKVTTGGTSVLYGPGGNGGVINIITKKGEKGVHGSVAGEAGEGDRYIGRATLSGADDKVDGFVSLSTYDRGHFRLSGDFDDTAYEGGNARENSDRERNNLFANLGYTISDRSQLGMTFNYLNGENGIPQITNYDKNDPFTKKIKYDRIDDLEGYSGQFSFDHRTDGPLEIRGWTYFNTLDMEENRYDDDNYNTQTQKGAYHQDSTTRIYGANVQLKYHMNNQSVATLGLMAENNEWDADGYTLDQKSKNDKTIVREYFDSDKELQLYTVALEYEVSPIDRLGLVFGYGHHFMEKEDGENEDDFSYLVSAWYQLTDETRLKASHARKIRFPSIKQLYDADSGNPDLEAERTYHYEAGIEQALPARTTLSLTGYYIEAKDFIEKDEGDINLNYEEYRFQGFEVGLENRYFKDLTLRATYSYLDSENKSDNSERDELQHRPEDKLTLEANYRFAFGLTAHAALLHVADQYFYDSDGEAPLEKKRLNDYTVVDLKLTQRLVEDRLDLYVGADNLFDEDYEQSYGLPRPGRTLYAGFEYRF